MFDRGQFLNLKLLQGIFQPVHLFHGREVPIRLHEIVHINALLNHLLQLLLVGLDLIKVFCLFLRFPHNLLVQFRAKICLYLRSDEHTSPSDLNGG